MCQNHNVLQLDPEEEEEWNICPHVSIADTSHAVLVSIVGNLRRQVKAKDTQIQDLSAQLASKEEAPGPLSFLELGDVEQPSIEDGEQPSIDDGEQPSIDDGEQPFIDDGEQLSIVDDSEQPSIDEGAYDEACPPSPLSWHPPPQPAADPAPGSKRPVSDAATMSRKKKVHSVCTHAYAVWVALDAAGLVHPAPDKQSFPEAMDLGLSHKAGCTECKNNYLLKCSYCPPTIALGHWPWKNPLRARHVGDAIAAGRVHTQAAHHRFWMAVHHLTAMHFTEEQVLQEKWKRDIRTLAHLLSNWESKYDGLGLFDEPESDTSVLFRKARTVVDSLK